MQPRIRAAEKHDVDDVLFVWRRADAKPTVTDDAASLRKLLAHDPRALFVAELDGQIIGTLVAAWDGWRGSFYRLAVLPQHRRRGVARALIVAGEAELYRRGADRLTAIVVADDEPATGFWERAGYERQSRRLRFVKNAAG